MLPSIPREGSLAASQPWHGGERASSALAAATTPRLSNLPYSAIGQMTYRNRCRGNFKVGASASIGECLL